MLTVVGLAILFVLSGSASAGSGDGLTILGGTPAQAGSTPAADADINLAHSIIDEWWGSTSERRYKLLSRTYKRSLRQALGISNARQYDKAVDVPERVWGKRIAQEVKWMGPDAVQISLLVEWRQEGYQGVMTFVFDMINEGGAWRVENVMH